jgi:methylamine utilization protein MauE
MGSDVGTALTAVAAGLLGAAGLAKLAGGGGDPLRDALADLRLPGWTARPLGALEAAVAAACLIRPGALALGLMAALFAGFAALSAVRLARGERAGCGCLWGDERLDPVHVGVDGVLAGIAGLAALDPPAGLADRLGGSPLAGAPLVVAVACAVYCLTLVMRHLSEAAGAYRPAREASR